MMTLITKGHGLYTEPLKRFSKMVGGRGIPEPGGIGPPVGFPWVPVSMINVLTPRKNCCREYEVQTLQKMIWHPCLSLWIK